MIAMYVPILVQTTDRAESKIDPKRWYQVIGALHRKYKKESGEIEEQDLAIIVNDEGRQTNVFLSKCKIKREDGKALSGFHAQDFLTT